MLSQVLKNLENVFGVFSGPKCCILLAVSIFVEGVQEDFCATVLYIPLINSTLKDP